MSATPSRGYLGQNFNAWSKTTMLLRPCDAEDYQGHAGGTFRLLELYPVIFTGPYGARNGTRLGSMNPNGDAIFHP